MGAAIAAAVGAGWFRTFNEAAHQMTGIKKIIKPEIQNYKKYRHLFAAYKSIYSSLKRSESLLSN